MQQIESTQELARSIGPYKVGVATYFITAFAMIVGSLLKNSFIKKNK
jgi:hypothetical protein